VAEVAEFRSGLRQVRGSHERGETLIEVLIAVVILGLVGAALAGTILTAVAGSTVSRRSADADALLRTFASGVASESQDPSLWSAGCLTPPIPIPTGLDNATFTISALPGRCNGQGFEAIVLEVTATSGDFTTTLEVWVRQP
jgi:prepilin-type N-terminal cleavage/methylation domain-containing protein